MLAIQLNEHDKSPLYIQIYEYIKKEITTGKLAPGTKLPSKRQLASDLSCSLNTVQAAYYQLVDEGYVYTKPKQGYFVSLIENLVLLDQSPTLLSGKTTKDNDTIIDCSYNSVSEEGFPFPIWKKTMKEVLDDEQERLLVAGPSLGDISLRRSIAQYLHQSRGVNCTWEQIVISSGTEYLMQLLIQLFGNDTVYALENPGYEKLNLIFANNNINYHAVPLDENGLRIDRLLSINANIAAVSPSHQFPSGLIMPITRRMELLSWANAKQKRFIIEDDYDSEFKYEGRPIPSLQGLDTYGNVIYIGNFSKSLAPSMRISYMVLPLILLEQYQKRLNFYQCPVSVMMQKTVAAFIDKGHFEKHLNRMRTIYKRKREILCESIQEHLTSAKILGANAGLHVVVQLQREKSEQELVRLAYLEGIRVYGMSSFYFDPAEIDHPPQILLGFAELNDTELYEIPARLQRIWN